MTTQFNMMMTNHALNPNMSEEDLSYLYADKEEQYGGKNGSKNGSQNGSQNGGKNNDGNHENDEDQEDRPNGGFPPIYVVDPEEQKKEQSKNRQLTGKKVGVSIKDILKSKK